MRMTTKLLALAAAATMLAGTAQAKTLRFHAALDGKTETSATGSAATGTAKVRVDTITKAPEGSPSNILYGKYLFNNPASSNQYNCARCHTKGFSYNGATVTDKNGQLLFPSGLISGGGFFGPNLTGGLTTRQFETVATHEDFVTSGSKIGVKYGQYGQGSGRMPGFGPRSDDSCEIPPDPGTGGAPVSACTYPAILTTEQIAAIVAYERSL